MTRRRAHLLLPLLALLPASCDDAPELQGRYRLDGADFARTMSKFLNLESRLPDGGRREVWLVLKKKATYELELYEDGTFRAVQDFDIVSKVKELQQLGKDKGSNESNGSKRDMSLHDIFYGDRGDKDKGGDARVSLRGWWRNQGLGQIELERTHVGDRADMDFVTASYMAGTLTLPVEVNGDPLTLRLNRRGNAAPPR